MKDGIADKLYDMVMQLDAEGELCTVVGMKYAALDLLQCDVCRYIALETITREAAQQMLSYYIKKREAANARSH